MDKVAIRFTKLFYENIIDKDMKMCEAFYKTKELLLIEYSNRTREIDMFKLLTTHSRDECIKRVSSFKHGKFESMSDHTVF